MTMLTTTTATTTTTTTTTAATTTTTESLVATWQYLWTVIEPALSEPRM